MISHAHEGLKAAIRRVIGATWQRCRVHFARNALAYASTQTGNFDLYLPFIEKGVSLLNAHGRLGYRSANRQFIASLPVPTRPKRFARRLLVEPSACNSLILSAATSCPRLAGA